MKTDIPRAKTVAIAEDDAGQRIDNYLGRVVKGVPRSHIYRLIRTGQVRVNGGRVKPHYKLAVGDAVRIPPVRDTDGPDRGEASARQRNLVEQSILYEDERVLAVNKPAGMAVHGGSGVRLGIIEILRLLRPGHTLELAHRLDRETSGCLLVAKRRSALRHMHASFRDGQVEKRYLALLSGHWAHGRSSVGTGLKRNLLQGGERMVRVDAGGKDARSSFRPLQLFADASFMEVTIDTGRTHQIRVHAAHQGHPVLGDDKYGDEAANRRFRKYGLKRMFLHAHAISLPHPSGEGDLSVEASLDDDLRAVLDRLEAK